MTFDETIIMTMAKTLHEKYAPIDILINQVIMTAGGVLVIFLLEQTDPLPPQQRVAMFDDRGECKWDNPG